MTDSETLTTLTLILGALILLGLLLMWRGSTCPRCGRRLVAREEQHECRT